MEKIKDLTGKTFGRLTVLKQAGRNKGKQVLWKCRCKCGKERIVVGVDLSRGKTKSCGCFRRNHALVKEEFVEDIIKMFTKFQKKFLDTRGRKGGR